MDGIDAGAEDICNSPGRFQNKMSGEILERTQIASLERTTRLFAASAQWQSLLTVDVTLRVTRLANGKHSSSSLRE